jgi:hypothetical protein
MFHEYIYISIETVMLSCIVSVSVSVYMYRLLYATKLLTMSP